MHVTSRAMFVRVGVGRAAWASGTSQQALDGEQNGADIVHGRPLLLQSAGRRHGALT